MHDESLEQKLRTALRTEGDQLAFTITAAELERRLALRHRGRLGPMASLGLAAAVGVGLLGLAGIAGGWFEQQTAVVPSPGPEASVSPSAGPSAGPSGEVVHLLPSLDSRVAAHDPALVVRAQAVGPADGPAATEPAGPRSVSFAAVSAPGMYTVELSCLGPGQIQVEVTQGVNEDPYTWWPFTCTGEVSARRIQLEVGDHLRLRSDQPASWRVVVDAPQRAALHAESISGLVVAPAGDTTLVEAWSPRAEPSYGPLETGGGLWLPRDVGLVLHRDQYRVLVSCAGPHSIRYTFRTNSIERIGVDDASTPPRTPEVDHSITEVECDGEVHQDVLDLPLDEAQLYVTSSDEIAWHIVVTGGPLPIALAPNEGGWVMSSGFGPNWEPDGQGSGVTGPGAENGGDVRVVVTCSGNTTMTGTIDVGPVAGQKLDPFTLDCTGAQTLTRTYPDAAPYVEVLYNPSGPRLWVAITIQTRAPESPAP